MSTTAEREKRAEFLRTNSPLSNTKVKEPESFIPPPILPEKNSATIHPTIAKLDPKKIEKNRLKFWETWNTNHYAGMSVLLGVVLIFSVVVSYTGFSGITGPNLNATLTTENQLESIEEEVLNNQDQVVLSEEIIIEEEVLDASDLVNELVQEETPEVTDLEGFDEFLDNYGM